MTTDAARVSLGASGPQATAKRRVPWQVPIFVVIALVLVAAARPEIAASHFEIGDFAANSLLIQDAKHFTLLEGNYSRIGFHHPGPAILYVLAFGEWLFHDVLGATQSPFGGQLIGGVLYTAFWIVLIASMLRDATRSALATVVSLALFLMSVAVADRNFFGGIWFPHLYFFPFATLLVAAARLASGRADALFALALGAGFTMNGHVSFLATTPILIVVAILANVVRYWSGPPERFVLGATFLRRNGRRIAGAMLMLLLFFVPLLLDTLLHFPGPVASYLQFSGEHQAHPFGEALAFTMLYWGSALAALLAVAGLWLADRSSSPEPIHGAVYGAVSAIFAATVAVTYYAMFGVDYLHFAYLAYFYYAAPCFAIAVIAQCAFGLVGDRTRVPLAGLLVLGCLVAIWSQIAQPAAYTDQYDEPELMSLYRSIRSAAQDGRIVLDLDDRQGWDRIWGDLAGVEAFAKRRRENLFCVNRNWHVLFTDAAKCNPDELRSHPRYVVRGAAKATVSVDGAEFQHLGIGFVRYAPPVVRGAFSVEANRQLFNDYLLYSGWSPADGDYVWSQQPTAKLSLNVGPRVAGSITLDLGAYLPLADSRQVVEVLAGDRVVGRYTFAPATSRQAVVVPFEASGENGLVEIDLHFPTPISPKSVGAGDDSRSLGASLFGLRVDVQP